MVYAEIIWANGSGSSSGGIRRCLLWRCLRRLRKRKTNTAKRRTPLDTPPASAAVEGVDDLCDVLTVGTAGETVEGEVAAELTDVAEFGTAPSRLPKPYLSLGVKPGPVVCGVFEPYPLSGNFLLLVVRG